jgi:hypothetical protein
MLNMVVSTAVKVNNIEKHIGSYYHNITKTCATLVTL